MQVNKLFSFQRFIKLTKQSLIINKKLIAISLIGFSGVMFFILMLLQWKKDISHWDNSDFMILLNIFFIILGIVYSGLSFPAFRNKEDSITYLLLPASVVEKFIFEILSRIVVFILIYPLLFWVIANIEGVVVHNFESKFINYKFSLSQGFSEVFKKIGSMDWWFWLFAIQGVLFVFIAPFTGASFFKKSPLLKTFFTFSIIIGGYALLTYFLVEGLNIQEYHPKNNTILFINLKHPQTFFAIAIAIVNLSLLTITFFRLKEKEV